MMPLAAILVLAAGTFAFRVVGPLARHRIDLPGRVERLLSDAAVEQLAGLARPAGVLVAGVLAFRRAPCPVIVIAAAATTAVLRLLGIA